MFKNGAKIELFEYCDIYGEEIIKVNVDMQYNGKFLARDISYNKDMIGDQSSKEKVFWMFDELRKNIEETLDNDLKPIKPKEKE